MDRPSSIQTSLYTVLLGLALATPAGAAMPDAWITMKTKLALLTTAGVSGMAINVDTVFGRVTLHGRVHSVEEQAQAETIAQQINGVQGVRNLLQVVAEQDEPAMQVADEALTERITRELQADPALQESRITVQSAHQGIVLLGGTAQTLSDHVHAVALVASVPGVRQVTSEVQSPDTLADAEIWREPTSPQPSAAAGLGAAVMARALPNVRAIQDDLRLATATH